MDTPFFIWILLPLMIIGARITDVSIGTLRIIFVMRGSKYIAALLGFFEVFVWILVISRLMSQSTHLLHYIAYATGFAVGNLVGITIEERLAFGLQTVRVITMQGVDELLMALKDMGCGATLIPAFGITGGRTTIIFTTVPRDKVTAIMRLVEHHTPRAFISIEDVRSAYEGVFPIPPGVHRIGRIFPFARKGK